MKSAGVVLAAGASRRMGRPKQLLPVDGRPMLELVTAHACASGLDEVVVVLGAGAGEILSRVELGRARPVLNSEHATGMSSSLRAGIAALGDAVERAVVILGDQPAISASLIDRLLDLHRASGLAAAALSYGDVLHPPVVLARELWPELMLLEGDIGCRAVIRARPEQVARMPVAPGHPLDLDTPDDYARLLSADAGG